MAEKYTLSHVLGVLEATRTRATYGAVAAVLRCSRWRLVRMLGARRPEASWVVSAKTGFPTGYRPHDLHRELQSRARIIRSASELSRLLADGVAAPVLGNDDQEVSGAPGWQEFERQVAEMYRRLGYHVTERGGAGPDGGVDIEIEKDGVRTVVQCKNWWRGERVGVEKVRELLGVMHHEYAHQAEFVTVGEFTDGAHRFASANPVSLVDGARLERCMRSVGMKWSQAESKFATRQPASPGRKSRRRKQKPRRGSVVFKLVTLGLLIIFVPIVVPRLVPVLVETVLPPSMRGVSPSTGTASPSQSSQTLRLYEAPQSAPGAKSRMAASARDSSVDEGVSQGRGEQFEAWYQPPPECEASLVRTREKLVDCVNHRIRARRAFLTSVGEPRSDP